MSEMLIHFDGWTERYDYWTETDAIDLHPIGFTKQKGHLIGYKKLEAPHGEKLIITTVIMSYYKL